MFYLEQLPDELLPIENNPRPAAEFDGLCVACIYFHKGLNRLQKLDFAFLVRRIFACIETTCDGAATCTHCRRLRKTIMRYYVNQSTLD